MNTEGDILNYKRPRALVRARCHRVCSESFSLTHSKCEEIYKKYLRSRIKSGRKQREKQNRKKIEEIYARVD